MRGYLFAGGSILLVTCAQLAMKWGMVRLPQGEDLTLLLMDIALYAVPLLLVLAGISAYICSMICWIMALNYLPLNRAYPLLSLSYALVYIAATLLPWYDERFSALRLAGVICIMVGIGLMNRRRRSN